MRLLAIAAQKGGVGKTTTAVHIALVLGRLGFRVLVVDLDPEGHATAILTPRMKHSVGTADVLRADGDPKKRSLADVIVETPAAGVDLCPATDDLENAELVLAAAQGREQLLKWALDDLDSPPWDLCIFDCPPKFGLLPLNALVAADAVLSTCFPSYLSVRSVKRIDDTVATVRRRLNQRLQSLGYLLCAVDEREAVTEASRERLRELVGKALWPIEVRVDAQLKRPAEAQDSRSRGAHDYEAVAKELRRRLKLAPKQGLERDPKTGTKQAPKRELKQAPEILS